jgi:hypothetical protein
MTSSDKYDREEPVNAPRDRRHKMTILPFQTEEVMHLNNRLSKIKPSTILNTKEPGSSKTIVDISAEGKKKQILDQARTEVLENIRQSK